MNDGLPHTQRVVGDPGLDRFKARLASARDEYPEAAGPTLSAYITQHAIMCDEIDRLRTENDGYVGLVAEVRHLVDTLEALQAEINQLKASAPDDETRP